MRRLAPILLPFALLAWVAAPWIVAQEPEEAPQPAPPVEATPSRELLDTIREDLVALRFEKALAALESLVTSPSLSDDERIEAMVLRSQTHAALGDFESAVESYRQILLRRPGWVPDRSLTPKKAMERFQSVRDGLIGSVRFALDPADATLWIDGQERLDTLESLPLIAGTHEIRVGRRGHDPVEQTLEIGAGENVELSVALVPNARTVILRTEPDDVEVWLDGRLAGRTTRVTDFAAIGQAPAQLVLEDVPLGEHTFEFRAECRRAEKIVDALNVDLLDRAPKRYDTVRLAESFVQLTPIGGPAGTELRVDGRTVTTLPAESVQACPGERDLRAVYAGRVLWSERVHLVEGVPSTLEIRARPNLALVGFDRLPRELEALQSSFNFSRVEASSSADFSLESTWAALVLEGHTDLVLAPDLDSRQGTASSWWLYSPVLRSFERLTRAATATEPSWSTVTWGLTLVDADGPLVAENRRAGAGSPAAGSRILSAAGVPVSDVADLRARLAAAADAGSIDIEWAGPDGTKASGRLAASVGPWLQDRGLGGIDAALRAAWAVVAAESRAPDAAAALANLALLLGAHGEHELAARTWRRVDWPDDRAGVGAGTVAYYLGRELQVLGRDSEAIVALRRAASSAARAENDDGPALAPAARDRLVDLGHRD